MKTKELLELAAKAAGIDVRYIKVWNGFFIHNPDTLPGEWLSWNPLTDDGDAFRLAVQLGFMESGVGFAKVLSELQQMLFPQNIDPNRQYVATRLAIVRAAAEIGKSL